MKTTLHPDFAGTADGMRGEAILRKCVHCGFCLATCPTYQLLGNELDSPRGRIYLVKQVLEGETPGRGSPSAPGHQRARLPSYLSTHPDMEERIELLKQGIAAAPH